MHGLIPTVNDVNVACGADNHRGSSVICGACLNGFAPLQVLRDNRFSSAGFA